MVAPITPRHGPFETMAFLKEFATFMMARKKFWLAPVVIVALLFGTVLVLSQGSVVAPFIYTLF